MVCPEPADYRTAPFSSYILSKPYYQLHHTIHTRHAVVHVTEIPALFEEPRYPPTPEALVLIHGNSSSTEIFKHVLEATKEAFLSYRVVAIDLPGHGKSRNASNPGPAYTQRGYAEAVVEVLERLGTYSFVVLGWSLGGHIAIEILGILGQTDVPVDVEGREVQGNGKDLVCKGVMITGTPPANGPEQVSEGFDPSDGEATAKAKASKPNDGGDDEEHMNYAAAETWPEEVYATFPAEGAGQPHEPWMEAMARRTDGKARTIMWASFAGGRGVDQRKVLETSTVPCAVVNGAAEPFVNLKAVERVKYRNLWEGKCYKLKHSETGRGLGHTPFWEDPKGFKPYLDRFIMHCFDA